MSYIDLLRSIAPLRKYYLPPDYLTTGRTMMPVELDLSGSYLIRCHGEVEEWFEEECRRIAQSALAKCRAGSWTRTAASLVAFCGPAASLKSELTQCFKNGSMIPEVDAYLMLEAAVVSYEKALDKNNGVKEKNLLAILLPIGIPCSTLSRIGLKRLTDLGAARGGLVHYSTSSWAAKGTVHPTVYAKKVTEALEEVKLLAGELIKLP